MNLIANLEKQGRRGLARVGHPKGTHGHEMHQRLGRDESHAAFLKEGDGVGKENR